MKKILAGLFFLFATAAQAQIVGTLPFQLQNGTTADANQVMADFNKLLNDTNANAAKNGVNTDITALTALITPITPAQGGSSVYFASTSGGTANAQTIASPTPTNFTLGVGKRVTFIAGLTNTGSMQLNVNSTGLVNVYRYTPDGPQALTGGEVIQNNYVEVVYDGTQYQLYTNATTPVYGTLTSLASATTTDLGTIPTHNVQITGTTTITAFGSTAITTYPVYKLAFGGSLTLTYNATSLILPGLANITTAQNDTAEAFYLGSGNWQIINYTRANGTGVLAILPMPSAFKNLSIKVATNTTVAVAADFVTMYNGTSSITAPCSGTTNLGTNGGVNALDGSNTIAINTWYYEYCISNGLTTVTLASASATSPTLPTGYTYKARVGAVKTINGSATLYGTWQFGRRVQYVVGLAQTTTAVRAATGTAGSISVPTWVSVTINGGNVQQSFVPSTASVVYVVLATDGVSMAAPNTSYGAYNSTTNPPPLVTDPSSFAALQGSLILESSAIFWAANTTSQLFVNGWEDNL